MSMKITIHLALGSRVSFKGEIFFGSPLLHGQLPAHWAINDKNKFPCKKVDPNTNGDSYKQSLSTIDYIFIVITQTFVNRVIFDHRQTMPGAPDTSIQELKTCLEKKARVVEL
jgi:hypothetical protein